jgi:hypothetical protein
MGRRKSDPKLVVTEFWEQFDAIELQTVATEGVRVEDKEVVWPILNREDITDNVRFVAYTVYGHLKIGGVEALADCPTVEIARVLAATISRATGLPIAYDVLVEWTDGPA